MGSVGLGKITETIMGICSDIFIAYRVARYEIKKEEGLVKRVIKFPVKFVRSYNTAYEKFYIIESRNRRC